MYKRKILNSMQVLVMVGLAACLNTGAEAEKANLHSVQITGKPPYRVRSATVVWRACRDCPNESWGRCAGSDAKKRGDNNFQISYRPANPTDDCANSSNVCQARIIYNKSGKGGAQSSGTENVGDMYQCDEGTTQKVVVPE
jgi:hypothetical protein